MSNSRPTRCVLRSEAAAQGPGRGAGASPAPAAHVEKLWVWRTVEGCGDRAEPCSSTAEGPP